MRFFLHGFLLLFISQAKAQSFDNWIVGDTSDYTQAQAKPGLLLAGGGGDNDDAMTWLLQRADGGDVLVLRESGSDGYNSYLYNDLGIAVNSVETIRFNQASAAQAPYVQRRIQEAELIFIAGGDQRQYELYWKDSPLETLIQQKITGPNAISIGGTSAGMVILGDYYYAPQQLGVTSTEALADPFHPNMDSIQASDFLQHPQAQNSFFDTHFDDRNRAGRFLSFFARITQDYGEQELIGIACNEYTAVAVDTLGQYRVFGDAPNFPDYAYFAYGICQDSPTTNSPGQALEWSQPTRVVRVEGRANPQAAMLRQGASLDIHPNYTDSLEIQWWSAQQGVLQIETNNACLPSNTRSLENKAPRIYPNPSQGRFWVESTRGIEKVELFNALGQRCQEQQGQGQQRVELRCGDLAPGLYFLRLNHSAKAWPVQVQR